MKTNELLRHLRKLLALNEQGMTDILAAGDYSADPEQVRNWLRQDNEPGFEPCPELVVAHFVEGLIITRRGPRDDSNAAPVTPLGNNQILKKLRIAFNLQGEDMHALFESTGQPLSKQELDALFRKPEHRNYRACSDATLRRFLQGLTERFRPR